MGLLLGSSIAVAPAFGDEPGTTDEPDAVVLPSITVTAEKTSAMEQDVPASMTVVTGDTLERSGTEEMIDVVRQVPNMYMTKAGQHASVAFFSMRGIAPFMEAEQPIGFFVDGVHYRNVDLELLDIERVEVLRGPQSVLYGRNTEAGAVNVITHDPEPFREATLSAGIGNYKRRTASVILGGPLGSNDWSYRLAARGLVSDGYFTRVPDGRDDVDEARDYNARFKLRWNPDDTWDLIATYDGQRYRDRSTNIAPLSQLYAHPHDVYSDYVGDNDSDVHSGNVRAIYRAPEFTLTSISAYTNEDKTSTYDVDASAFNLLRLTTDVRYSRYSQELRLSSPDRADGPRWLAGLYYFNQTEHNGFAMDMGGMGYGVQSAQTKTRTRNLAAFGQVTWPLTERLSLITGLRYDHERKSADNHQIWTAMGVDFVDNRDMTFKAWLPKLGLEYRPLPNLLTYAIFSKGYKAGGYNNLADRGSEVYDAEYTTNYEIGLKHTSTDERLQTRLSLFYIQWTDQQVEELILTESNLTNAGESVSRGIELETAWQATRSLLLKAGGGWNDAHFVDYDYGGQDLSGKRPPNAPGYTYSLSADYGFGNGAYAHAGWQANGPVYFDSPNTQKQTDYGLLNLTVGYQFDRYEVALWIRNALDETYVTRAFDIGGGTYAGIAGDPRTYGLTLTALW